jgi:hypothetical protein
LCIGTGILPLERAAANREPNMKYRSTILLISITNLFCNCIGAAPVSQQHCDKAIPLLEKELASLLSLYKELHTHPELSFQESETSARVAEELTRTGFNKP